MNSDRNKGQTTPQKSKSGKGSNHRTAAEPAWAGGLRKLYDSVVEEPIPDSFKVLLSKLEDSK